MSKAAGLALRLALACACALLVAQRWGEPLTRGALPPLRTLLQAATPDFRIVDIGLVRDRGALSVGAVAVQARTVVLEGRAVVPDEPPPLLVGMTTAGSLWQPLFVALVAVLAWPWQRVRELPWRLAAVALLVPLAAALDAPLSMAASLWSGLLQSQGSSEPSPLLAWGLFLDGGGRLLMGVAAGTAGVAFGRRMAPLR